MEMSDSLVYHVERFTSRLFGASTEWPRCSVDIEDREYREVCPTMDCTLGAMDRFAAVEHSGIYIRTQTLSK